MKTLPKRFVSKFSGGMVGDASSAVACPTWRSIINVFAAEAEMTNRST